MKRKLNIVFTLMAVSLLGIILFQLYWTLNAYQVNKGKFDSRINTAFQNALDECKKDYFDSIRRVLVKRLSPAETTIRIDTLIIPNVKDTTYEILLLNKKTLPGKPFTTSQSKINFYRTKINHPATLPELLTEMSFYEPVLIRFIIDSYGFSIIGPSFTMNDIHRHPDLFRTQFFNGKTPLGMAFNDKVATDLPPFYQRLRDSAIIAYFKNQQKQDVGAAPAHQNLITPPPKVVGQGVKKTSPGANYKAAYDVARKFFIGNEKSFFGYPAGYRKADSLKLYQYLKTELEKIDILSPFKLDLSTVSMVAAKLNGHYSETDEFEYQYHGFKVFGIGPPSLFVRAKFLNPQYGVLKNMLATLSLSLMLIVFTIFCFNYIFRTFIEQKKLSDLKDDFINNMTHELKTPIATIAVAIEGLQSFNAGSDPEKTRRYLQTSRNELFRLNDLVNKVLDIATFENKKTDLLLQPIAVNDLVNEVINSEKGKTSKTTEFTFLNADSLESVYADRVHFKNVLINLVDNAIKYAVEPIIIAISCYKTDGYAVFAVKDNGIGIPAAHIGQIFDKFHRVPTGNVHNVKGTGLGLSYVKYIVEAHGGKITVASEINKGSEFKVYIPLSNG